MFQGSILFGHTHRVQKQSWTQGFAVVYVMDSGACVTHETKSPPVP